ncbi:NAD-dependent deacylase [Chryseobacterium sp. H3056]|uniref:NAD-dependent protein deacylase n=1 Tax=Kaistella daneshvariae TaxID=2487074 RepID=A0A3N0WZM4_9FLAO|nr:NAD-dependent deacylase [Kaistella daneshvariae]ROI10550.1 NAD-dependent deacylase [Kaistella daneshvariae]
MKRKLVVLSGAGISAESGVRTFRDSNGLWEEHRVEDVASPEGFARNPHLVLDFYNARRRQLLEVKPNRAHEILAELETDFDVHIITQNVDDLHERAGSSQVLHLHGELKKARPVKSKSEVISWDKDLNIGDVSENGEQLRPNIVWFGEMVPEMEKAEKLVQEAGIFVVIGTSLNVYPAAGLLYEVSADCEIYIIDPEIPKHIGGNFNVIQTTATNGMALLQQKLLNS